MIKKILIFLINIYQKMIAPFLGNHCRFYPSCSCYAKEAIQTKNLILGLWLSAVRISKCQPFNLGGFDPLE